MKTFCAGAAGLLLPLVSIGLADDIKPFDGKPGLWETTAVTEIEGMPAMPAMPQIPPETLAKMPPEQRAKIEAMMKNRGNLGAPRTTTSKACHTRESFSKGFGAPDNKSVECTRQIVSSTSSRTQIHLECTPTGGGPKSVGDMTMERIDSEHVRGNMITKTAANDKAMTIKMNFDSKWVSADCGDVKPYTPR